MKPIDETWATDGPDIYLETEDTGYDRGIGTFRPEDEDPDEQPVWETMGQGTLVRDVFSGPLR